MILVYPDMVELVVGIDASYKGLGLAIVSITNNTLNLFELTTMESLKTFQGCVKGALGLTDQVLRIIKGFTPDKVSVLIEIPPHSGRFGPGLFLLNGILCREFSKCGYTVVGVHCKVVKSVNGVVNSTKADSVAFILGFLFPNLRVLIKSISGKFKTVITSHNQAEALILLMLYCEFLNLDIFPEFKMLNRKDLVGIKFVNILESEKSTNAE